MIKLIKIIFIALVLFCILYANVIEIQKSTKEKQNLGRIHCGGLLGYGCDWITLERVDGVYRVLCKNGRTYDVPVNECRVDYP